MDMMKEKRKTRNLNVPLALKVHTAWTKFRQSRKLSRGPLEEAALNEYMRNHKNPREFMPER
jgi:hypothetical protein